MFCDTDSHYQDVNKVPQIPKPTNKYSPAKTKRTIAVFRLCLLIANPIIVNSNGGPSIIPANKTTIPFKFSTSNATMI